MKRPGCSLVASRGRVAYSILALVLGAVLAAGCFEMVDGPDRAWFVVRGFTQSEVVAGPYATQAECDSAAAAWRRSSRTYPYPYYACEQR